MNEEKVREVKMEPALELSTVPSDHKFKNPGFYKENINWKQHSLILEEHVIEHWQDGNATGKRNSTKNGRH